MRFHPSRPPAPVCPRPLLRFSLRGLALFLLIIAGIGHPAWAVGSADDYFHSASSLFVEGRMQQALVEVEEGLRKFPADQKLGMLHGQLKKLTEQKQQDQEGQNDQNQDDQKKADDKKEDQDQQDPKDTQDEPKPGEQPKDSSSQEEEQQGKKPPPQGEMSEDEAKNLLDSYKEDEKRSLEEQQKKPGRGGRPAVDW